MSAGVRAELAAAASSVDTVTCSAYYRQTTKPGDAWVRLDVFNRDDTGFGYMVAWQICVLLPKDQAAAEKWIDAHVDDLLTALGEEGVVTTAGPYQLTVGTSTVPAFIVTVIRAKE